MSDPLFLVAATLLGAIIGSYLNVVIYRLPRADGKRLGRRSVCPGCGAPIPARWNIPVFGWIVLRGRARCCGVWISPRYPLVEALTAGLFFLLAVFPPSGELLRSAEFPSTAFLAFAFHGYFVANLIANTFIDLDHRILPDVLTKPLMVVGVVGCALLPGRVGGVFEPLRGDLPDAANALMFSLVGLGVGFGVTLLIRWLARAAFHKEALGFGDVKLMGGVGAFLGWDGALLTFFLGCVAGAIGGGLTRLITRDPYVAFGPYLALGAVVTLFAADPIVRFLTVTWPAWQQEYVSSPWAIVAVGVICLFLMLHLIRRGRST